MLESVAINKSRVDLLHQYSMIVAANEDDWQSRELGPIHLIKLAYLADWACARRRGEAFTGAQWRFHHFGPWQAEVFDRIEPALDAIHCTRKVLSSSRYQDDFVRYSLEDDVRRLREKLEEELPLGVAGAIQQAIRQFGSDTASLLRHVYLTPPMLYAAPGEVLDLSLGNADKVSEAVPADRLTPKQMKERKKVVEQLKRRVQERLQQKSAKGASMVPAVQPRYDDLFVAGTEWLDVLSGEPPAEMEGELVISSDVWKSGARTDPDVP